jgi:hypothetical protein
MRLSACVALALLVALTGCGADHPAPAPHVVRARDGIRYAIPNGWHAASRSLTPHLVDPREVLTAGTGALPSGGGCSHMPTAALKAMGPRDALVTVQERAGSVSAFPARPQHFRLPPAQRVDADECAGPRAAFVSHWFEFRDGARGFYVLVAMGRSAPAQREREALALLDSLVVR